jgi:hypothetical protein
MVKTAPFDKDIDPYYTLDSDNEAEQLWTIS